MIEMINYCPRCGTKTEGNALFCINCGLRINETSEVKFKPRSEEIHSFEKQIAYSSKETANNQNINYLPISQYNQPQNYANTRQAHKKRMILPITAVAIVFMIILASFIIVINTDNEDANNQSEITKLVKEHGPKLSLHSLSGGSISSIPKEGYTATYGLYDENGIFGIPKLRIGEITEENLGEKIFQGEECVLIKISGLISIPIKKYMESYFEVASYYSTDSEYIEMLNMMPEEIPIYIYSDYYVAKEDNIPVYMDYQTDLTEYMSILKDISLSIYQEDYMGLAEFDETVIMGYIIDWDRATSKADMSFYMQGIPYMNMGGNFSIEFSEEYWDIEPEMEELYVGFEKIVEFTMTLTLDDFYFDANYNLEDEEESDEYFGEDDIYDLKNKSSQNVSTSMQITVIAKENVKVPAGTFNDCFVIEVIQRQKTNYDDYYGYSDSSTSSTKIWIDENSVMLKAEYNLFATNMGMDSSDQKLVIKLEDYTK